MLITILRAVLFFLIAQLLLRFLRALGALGRGTLPPAGPFRPGPPPSPDPRPPEIDPGDIIDATYREVKD